MTVYELVLFITLMGSKIELPLGETHVFVTEHECVMYQHRMIAQKKAFLSSFESEYPNLTMKDITYKCNKTTMVID